jgi:hypothetical protein
MAKKSKPIPASVLSVLKHEWQPADPNYSSFDGQFNEDDKGRKSEPSYYHISPGKKVETDFDVFSHAEASKLAEEGVFARLAKVQNNGTVTINEHAQHALSDFCSEVYSAWKKYQHRLAKVEKACPPLDD